ncbi:MAG: SDR family oxidoreductase [Actinomycetia bacterium]|nr:SDR family oxidoreductase [Actinomycetes bacterium]
MSDLSGKRMLVTGGGTGSGADLARGFAAAGAEVVITGRRREQLDVVAASAPRIRAVTGDVTSEADVIRMFAEAGPVDIVIANAGVAASAPLVRTSLDLWHEMIDTNLTGAFLTLREGLRQLEGRGWGRLLVISSITGLKGYPYVSAYGASKHGVIGLMRMVAQEVAGTGVTSNALCPSYINTEMTERTIVNIMEKTGRTREAALQSITKMSPMGRLVEPAEVTAAALWLCGAGSDAVNGQSIGIAGGEV